MIRKKRCGKAVCAVLSLLILCAGPAAAHTAYVENSGTAAYKSVRLTPQIYQYANADLSDLMLMDDNGEPMPYFIRSCDQTVQENKTVYPMEFIDSYIKGTTRFILTTGFGLCRTATSQRIRFSLQRKIPALQNR